MRNWVSSILVFATVPLCGCDFLTGLEAEDIGSFELIVAPELEIAAPGEVKEAVYLVEEKDGSPVKGLEVTVSYSPVPGETNPGFEFGATSGGTFGSTTTVRTNGRGEAHFFVKYPPGYTGMIETYEEVFLKGFLPKLDLKALRVYSNVFDVTLVPFSFTPVFLGDVEALWLNNQSQVLARSPTSPEQNAVIIDSDGTVHATPVPGTGGKFFTDSAEIVWRGPNGQVHLWQEGSTVESLGEFETVWASSNGLILADSLLWRDGNPERIPERPEDPFGYTPPRWRRVNAKGELLAYTPNWIFVWNGREIESFGPWVNGVSVVGFSDAGELLAFGYHGSLWVPRSVHPDVHPHSGPYQGGGALNSLGTMVSRWPSGLFIQHGDWAPISLILVAAGYDASEFGMSGGYQINDLGEILANGVIDGQEGAYLLRPTGGYPSVPAVLARQPDALLWTWR